MARKPLDPRPQGADAGGRLGGPRAAGAAGAVSGLAAAFPDVVSRAVRSGTAGGRLGGPRADRARDDVGEGRGEPGDGAGGAGRERLVDQRLRPDEQVEALGEVRRQPG